MDITEVPDFNKMYELYDPCTVMFFFRYTVVLEYNSTECVLVQCLSRTTDSLRIHISILVVIYLLF